MPNKISLLCTYNSTNDQLSVDLSRGTEQLNADDTDLTTKAVGHVISGMNTVIDGLAPSGNFAKAFTAGRAFVLEFGYDYTNNLRQAQQQYGEEGCTDELVALGKSMISFGVDFAGTEAGKVVGSLLLSTPAGRIGGAIVGGVVSSSVYDKYLEKPVNEFFGEIFTPDLHIKPSRTGVSRVAVGYQSPDSGELQNEVTTIFQGQSGGDTLVAGSRSSLLVGGDGFDTYYFPTLQNQYVVNDSDNNGIIVIGDGKQSIKLTGNAEPKTDASNNVIPNSWMLAGFELKKSDSGTDLVITKAGTAANSGSITVKNFPFTNARGAFATSQLIENLA